MIVGFLCQCHHFIIILHVLCKKDGNVVDHLTLTLILVHWAGMFCSHTDNMFGHSSTHIECGMYPCNVGQLNKLLWRLWEMLADGCYVILCDSVFRFTVSWGITWKTCILIRWTIQMFWSDVKFVWCWYCNMNKMETCSKDQHEYQMLDQKVLLVMLVKEIIHPRM